MASKTEKKRNLPSYQGLSPIQINLLELLKENGSMTRDQICEKFGFGKHTVEYNQIYPNNQQPKKIYHINLQQYDKRSTIYDNLVKLQKRKLIEKFSRSNGRRGRPLVYWKIKNVVKNE